MGAQGQCYSRGKHQRADREMRRRQQDNCVDRQSPQDGKFRQVGQRPSKICASVSAKSISAGRVRTRWVE